MKKRKRKPGPVAVKPLQAARVWNVALKTGGAIKVATIEQAGRVRTMCDGCSAPCCKGMLHPILNEEEFTSRKFPFQYAPVPAWLLEKIGPIADCIAVVHVNESGCVFHDHKTNLCRIWPHCPESCKAYDCRQDTREPIATFAQARQDELSKNNGRIGSD